MKRSLPVIIVALMALPAATSAQQATARFDAARIGTAPAVPLAEPRTTAESAPDTNGRAASRSFLAKALHLVGGAVVGGWLGYVSSQVALSDWEKDTNSSFNEQRSVWVAGGMVVGILGSRLVGGTTAPGRPALEVQRPRGDRNMLTREEIVSSGATSVYELVSSLRREWLITRGTNTLGEGARGFGDGMGPGARMEVQPGQTTIIVYMDDIRLGAVDAMREVLINDIMEIRFLDPREATYRYGAGHTHGAILLTTSL